MLKRALTLVAILLSASALAEAGLLITGAGATFPYPIYSKWFSDYHQLHPDIRINYQSIGSGAGIRQITDGTVDFGASDAPMTDDELAKAPDVTHIPTVIGSVVVAYNVPGVEDLKLTPATLSGIFLGKITQWNDPALVADNPGMSLPALAISVAHRADGSGTTAVFTDYLAKVSPEWKDKVHAGKSVHWPVGLGGKGNEGVTGLIRQTPGTVGYVELAYAHENKLPTAKLKNRAGNYITATVASSSAAAMGVALPEDFRVSITDSPAPKAYPIASFTYLLVKRHPRDPAKGKAILKFLGWAMTKGQKETAALDYAPLPAPVVKKVEATVASLKSELERGGR